MGNFSLKIEDFQSISNADLEFIPGINLIVGQSNSGKTAVLRAIDSALTNPTYAKSFVKHHKNGATVTFNYEGNHISWSKGAKGAVTYNVNDEEYSKMGTSDLFSILPNNGFVKSDSGDIMNIEGEWDLPFPFDRTPSELFKLFENVFCVSDSATILKSYKEEETDLAKQVSDIKDKIKRNTNKLNALEELEKEANLEEVKKNLSNFESIASEYFGLIEDYEGILRSEKFSSFVIDEKLPPSENTLDKVLEGERDLKFLTNVAEKIKFYKTLPEALSITDTLGLYNSTMTDFETIHMGKLADGFKIDKELEISNVNIDAYLNLLEDLKDIETGAKVNNIVLDKECKIEKSNTLNEYVELKQDLADIMNCFSRCKQLTADGKELVGKIANIEEKLKEYKVCPLCGHELNGEHEEC